MNLVAAELLKLRTTRVSLVLTLLAVVLAAVATAAIVGSGSLADGRALALAQGASFASILATVLGILLVTNEYRHGTITTTFLVQPDRVRVLLAKLAAAAVAGLALAVAVTATLAVVGLPWLSARGEALELDGQAAEAVGRLLLAFVLYTLLGAAVGAIVQSQVGAIVTVFVWFLVVESLVGVLSSLLLGGLDEPDPVTPYLPGSALGGVVGGQGGELVLGGGAATLLALAYVAALAGLGAVSMLRRDPS